MLHLFILFVFIYLLYSIHLVYLFCFIFIFYICTLYIFRYLCISLLSYFLESMWAMLKRPVQGPLTLLHNWWCRLCSTYLRRCPREACHPPRFCLARAKYVSMSVLHDGFICFAGPWQGETLEFIIYDQGLLNARVEGRVSLQTSTCRGCTGCLSLPGLGQPNPAVLWSRGRCSEED